MIKPKNTNILKLNQDQRDELRRKLQQLFKRGWHKIPSAKLKNAVAILQRRAENE